MRKSADLRYQRQISFSKIGQTGQDKLKKTSIAIIGVGAIGSVVAELLTRAGIGRLLLIDPDLVDITNLQRQALYTEKDINKLKVNSLKKHLTQINSTTKITTSAKLLTVDTISALTADLILDCTDNQETRFLINAHCIQKNIPWIHSAAIQDKAQLQVILPNKTPCFNCVFKNLIKNKSCEEEGVLNSTTHIIAAVQAKEAIKLLIGYVPEKNLLRFDLWNNKITKIKIKKDKTCVVCKKQIKHTNKKNKRIQITKTKECNLQPNKTEFELSECKTRAAISVKPTKKTKLDLTKIKNHFKTLIDTSLLIVIKEKDEIIVHGYGELIFKKLKNKADIRRIAKKIYSVGRK